MATRQSLAGKTATITADGGIEFEGTIYKSPSAAAVAASGKKAEAGWEFWVVERDGAPVSLYELRLLAEDAALNESSV